MSGTGHLRLSELPSKHQWQRLDSDEALDMMRARKDRLLHGVLAIILGLLLAAVVSTVFSRPLMAELSRSPDLHHNFRY